MDTHTGEVTRIEALRQALGHDEFERRVRPVKTENLPPRRQAELRATGRTKISRNESCPCGSGQKFKRGCLDAPVEIINARLGALKSELAELGATKRELEVMMADAANLKLSGSVTVAGNTKFSVVEN